MAVRIYGCGTTKLGKLNKSATSLMQSALQSALADATLDLSDLDGLVAVPSLSEPRFMEAHYLATRIGMLPHRGVRVRTIDTGGAGPISALMEAVRMVKVEGCRAVAVVAGDAVSSLPTDEFLRRADAGCADSSDPDALQSPVIPNGYGRIAEWHQTTYGVTREQLAMVSVLMSRQAARHPLALTRTPHTLAEVLAAPPVAPSTTLLECARRADGGAAIIVADAEWMQSQRGKKRSEGVVYLGGGEASGPLFPPSVIDESLFSCEQAARIAYREAQLMPADIDFFGLYDCFPICFLRAVEAVGLAKKGEGGAWIERMHNDVTAPSAQSSSNTEQGAGESFDYSPSEFPVNTHGGLLGFGAPWETPALYNVIESVAQLTKKAGSERQVENARRALVYGNGGIFSHSAVAILAAPVDTRASYDRRDDG